MKKNRMLRRTLSIAAAAVMLTGTMAVQALAANFLSPGSNAVTTVNNLNIRSGPGLEHHKVGVLPDGYTVKIRETQDGWGRIDSGWVCLDYLRPVVVSGNRYSETDYAYVNVSSVNVRQGPGYNYQISGTLNRNAKVTILYVEDGWAKTNEGWVALDYLSSSTNSAPAIHDSTSSAGGYNVRVTADYLNVRDGAGTGYARNGQLRNGSTVEILETRGNWGRIRQGWICLDYTTAAGSTNSSNNSSSGKIGVGSKIEVTADALRIRAGAGVQHQINGVANKGYRATIREISGDWGRIDSGWINLDYVRGL